MFADPTYSSFSHQHYSYVSRGMYAQQLERGGDISLAEQVLLLRSEDLFENPSELYAQVVTFLGVTPVPLGAFPRHNAGAYPTPDPALHTHLVELFKPHNERLEALVGCSFGWTKAKKL